MVNQTVFDYFRKNKGKYPLEALKAKALSAGYSLEDVNDAIVMLEKREGRGLKKETKEKKEEGKKEQTVENASERSNKRVLLVSGIFALFFFAASLVFLNLWVYFNVDLARVFSAPIAFVFGLLVCVYYFLFLKSFSSSLKIFKIATVSKAVLGLLLPFAYLVVRPILLGENILSSRLGSIFLTVFGLAFLAANFLLSISLLKEKDFYFSRAIGAIGILYSISVAVFIINSLIVYFSFGQSGIPISSLSVLYWEFIISAVFWVSAFFFEAMGFFIESKKRN